MAYLFKNCHKFIGTLTKLTICTVVVIIYKFSAAINNQLTSFPTSSVSSQRVSSPQEVSTQGVSTQGVSSPLEVSTQGVSSPGTLIQAVARPSTVRGQ